MPQVGSRRDQHHRRSAIELAGFPAPQLDLLTLPATYAAAALRGAALAPDLAKKGVYLSRILEPGISYSAFNMRDPVVGGTAKEKVALRRAVAMAYSNQREIEVIHKGQAVPLEMPVPPGLAGSSSQLPEQHPT